MKGVNLLRKVTFHPDFEQTVEELRDKKIFFDNITPASGSERVTEVYSGENKLEKIEEGWKFPLNIKNGLTILVVSIWRYDRNYQKFRSLEEHRSRGARDRHLGENGVPLPWSPSISTPCPGAITLKPEIFGSTEA